MSKFRPRFSRRVQKSTILRFAGLALASLTFAAAGASQASAEYPDHIINFVVPGGPGSSLDILTRVMQPYMAQDFGQTVIVKNRPGGDNMIGLADVAHAPADGYTIIFSGGAESIAPALHTKLQYDPLALTAISYFASTPNMVGVNSKLGVTTLADFVNYAKKSPGTLKAAVSGNGAKVSVALFELTAGVQVMMVPYADTVQLKTSLLSGETDFSIMDSLAFASMSDSPSIHLLAVTDTQRSARFPNVPTTAEAGLSGLVVGTRYCILTGAKTPPAVVAKLSAEIAKIVQIPDVIAQFAKLNVVIKFESPADSQRDYLANLKQWKDVVEKAHVTMSN